ncbi:complex I subunit 5 family protein [Fusibacter tunisiensis]|uniref:Multicomponent Na+:H+ antiporter subunit D n=1 Tax=Fusibacter tunisiensis TaxID=1008308 RepID=A0ABS2MS79_9FIRM|nr:proton-conducting transporter membrane subunit [Fusibacter tunisiensis]MBM7562212.1 multicomponent Na+:H+ antiporter subunit D [Fusibacter tunisiensis]
MTPHLIGFILLPIVASLTLYIFKNTKFRVISVAIELFLFLVSVSFIQTGSHFDLLVNVPLPYGMALKLDSLSGAMLLLNNFLFLAMTVYSIKRPYANQLFMFIFLSLQGLINALFLSTDFFNVYILIEVATIAVSILIMYKKDSQSMYDGMIYLLVNMVAMAFFLFGIGFLYKQYGVLDFVTIGALIEKSNTPETLYLPYALLITGVSLKAALMPLFSWLPKAHGTASAPAVVSAILSGIFVKVGVYMLIRLQILFNPAIDIQSFFLFLGFLTAIAGFVFAISHTDIKLILAYHTVSQIGLILIGISGSSELNFLGGTYHILSHGVFKSLFFLSSGLLVQHYKTRKIKHMTGLWQSSKWLSLVLMSAILSITGAPFFSGGYAKYFISYGYQGLAYDALFLVINLGTMVSFIKFIHVIFSKNENPEPVVIDPFQRTVITIMGLTCFILGTFGPFLSNAIFGISGQMTLTDQIGKLPTYLLTYALAYGIYALISKQKVVLRKIRSLELSFNSINLAVVSFFFATLAYLTYLH